MLVGGDDDDGTQNSCKLLWLNKNSNFKQMGTVSVLKKAHSEYGNKAEIRLMTLREIGPQMGAL